MNALAALNALRDRIFETSFTPERGGRRSIGAEVELLLLDETNRPLAMHAGGRMAAAAIQRYAAVAGWRESPGYDGTVRFEVPGRAIVSFEPGGQLEISTVPCATPSALLRLLRRIVQPLRAELCREGISAVTLGIDPFNDAADVPLQLRVDRYERMTRYFDSIGPFGARMMRQTAALQLSVDRGERPAERWRLLNDLAPYVIAIFANSRYHRGEDTGHQSYRAHCWRMLDPARTGMAESDDDPAGAYTRFALKAPDMMRVDGEGEGPYQPFASWLERDRSDRADSIQRWTTHLTTLFPEVRPRGHFELRSCDAIDPAHHAAPIVFVSGLVYDERSATEAAWLAAESRVLLRMAGERGLRDVAIGRVARDLFALALAGAGRLGEAFIDGESLEAAEAYYAAYTARDRSPADDSGSAAPMAAAR